MENADFTLTAEFTDYLPDEPPADVADAPADEFDFAPVDLSAPVIEIAQEELIGTLEEVVPDVAAIDCPLPGEGQWVFMDGGRVFVPDDIDDWFAIGNYSDWIPDGVIA